MTKILTSLALAAGLVFPVLVSAADLSSPVGLWRSIDDETKQPKALVRVNDSGGIYSARIEKILTDKTDAVCERCTDSRKDKPVQGMTIMEGVRADGDEFGGGKILDPNNGKLYSVKMKLRDGGQRLEVRGFLGISLFGRTQVWERIE